MVLNNYKKWKMGMESYFYLWANQSGTKAVMDLGMINYNGHANNTAVGFNVQALSSQNMNLAYDQLRIDKNFKFAIGAGDAPISADDYCLHDDITDCFTNLVFNYNPALYDDQLERTFTISGVNNTANPYTISQVGYVKGLQTTVESTWTTIDFLMAVIPLDAPLTVNPHEGFAITVKWIDR